MVKTDSVERKQDDPRVLYSSWVHTEQEDCIHTGFGKLLTEQQ